jgi:prephenate dehydrogenase
LGAIDDWTLDVCKAVADADLVVLCMPVSQIPVWLERIGQNLKPGSVVTDVGSTKLAICDAGARHIVAPGAFVGSHPMAGSEKTGVAVARADLFDGATCVVTPAADADNGAIRKVCDFWTTLGCRIVQHDPATHDRLVAMVSHLPHAVAAALVGVQSDDSLDLRGRGFMDSTRIAAGDAGLWRDILIDNRQNVIDAIGHLHQELDQLTASLRTGDAAAVESWLARQVQRRNRL